MTHKEVARIEATDTFDLLREGLSSSDEGVWQALHGLTQEMHSGTRREDVEEVSISVEKYRDPDTGVRYGICFESGWKPLKELVSACFKAEGIEYTGPTDHGIFSVQYALMTRHAESIIDLVNEVAAEIDTADELQAQMESGDL